MRGEVKNQQLHQRVAQAQHPSTVLGALHSRPAMAELQFLQMGKTVPTPSMGPINNEIQTR